MKAWEFGGLTHDERNTPRPELTLDERIEARHQAMSIYLENFSDKQDVISSFSIEPDALKGATIHFAWYVDGSYCGAALVVFQKDGKLYEVNGSHCSCYGLEGQWEPEETSADALAARDLSGEYDGSSEATEKLHALAKRLGASTHNQ